MITARCLIVGIGKYTSIEEYSTGGAVLHTAYQVRIDRCNLERSNTKDGQSYCSGCTYIDVDGVVIPRNKMIGCLGSHYA